MIEIAVVDTPIDALTLAARNGRLCLLHFGGDDESVRAKLQRWYPEETIEHGHETLAGPRPHSLIISPVTSMPSTASPSR